MENQIEERFHYHKFLKQVQEADLEEVISKDISYGASWKKRGGVGAFMMLARKWDRLEELLSGKYGHDYKYDIFAATIHNMSGADGTVLAEIRDLRRYLLLVEAEVLWQSENSKSNPAS